MSVKKTSSTTNKASNQLQYRLIADMDKCTGCQACSLACSFAKHKAFNPAFARIRILKFDESGVDAPIVCQQCEEPRCMEACPQNAIVWQDGTGIIIIDDAACDGCGICATACLYAAISVRPGSTGKRNKVMLKCDLCGGNPECIKWCETGAIQYVSATWQEQINKARENLVMARKRYEIEYGKPLWKY